MHGDKNLVEMGAVISAGVAEIHSHLKQFPLLPIKYQSASWL